MAQTKKEVDMVVSTVKDTQPRLQRNHMIHGRAVLHDGPRLRRECAVHILLHPTTANPLEGQLTFWKFSWSGF